MTDPEPAQDPPVPIAWDPEGDELASIPPVTVTVTEADARGGQHT